MTPKAISWIIHGWIELGVWRDTTHYIVINQRTLLTFSPYNSLDSLVMTLNTQPRSNSMLKSVRVAVVNESTVSIVQVPRSQPIPIIKTKCKGNHEDELVDTSHYDLMTWNMYARIVTARRLRASIQMQDYISQYSSMDKSDNQKQKLMYQDVLRS